MAVFSNAFAVPGTKIPNITVAKVKSKLGTTIAEFQVQCFKESYINFIKPPFLSIDYSRGNLLIYNMFRKYTIFIQKYSILCIVSHDDN